MQTDKTSPKEAKKLDKNTKKSQRVIKKWSKVEKS